MRGRNRAGAAYAKCSGLFSLIRWHAARLYFVTHCTFAHEWAVEDMRSWDVVAHFARV